MGREQEPTTERTAAPAGGDNDVTLLDPAHQDRFRQRWSDIQARFVDDPKDAVQNADGLVADTAGSRG